MNYLIFIIRVVKRALGGAAFAESVHLILVHIHRAVILVGIVIIGVMRAVVANQIRSSSCGITSS